MRLKELIVESMSDKLLVNTLSYLQKKFETEKSIKFEIVPLSSLIQKSIGLPADARGIRMSVSSASPASPKRESVDSARSYLDYVLNQRFPEGNILDVELLLVKLNDGALIILKQGVKEGMDPLLAKVYGRIYDIISTLNHDWWKDFGDKQHYLFNLHPSIKDDRLLFRLTRDTNFDFEHFYQGIDYIKEALDEEGYLDGLMPIDVHFSKPFGDPVKVDITVTRSGRKQG